MFSVIIPLYNKELSIKSTIESVLNQTYSEFELIVINDGSTDGSLAVVQSISDSRISVITKENGGVSSARNYGIKKSRREWLAFLDGDDLWDPTHLEKYREFITTNDDLNWIISGYRSQNNRRVFNHKFSKNGILENVIDDLLNGLKIHTSTICIRKSNFDLYPELYFREDISNSEDREVWYKMCCIDRSPYYIKEILSSYILEVDNSLTNSANVTKDSYLGLFKRLSSSSMFQKLNEENQIKLKKYIDTFNTKAIKGFYLRNGRLKQTYKEHLSKKEWILLNLTSKFPYFFKKIITRLC